MRGHKKGARAFIVRSLRPPRRSGALMQCPATAHGADGRGLVPPQMIDFLLTHKIPAKKNTYGTLNGTLLVEHY